MNIELDIKNYTFNDILFFFDISKDLTEEDFINVKNIKTELNNTSVDVNIKELILQLELLLICINKYRNYIKINNPDYNYTIDDDNFIISKIVLIKNFHQYNDLSFIIKKIVNENIKSKNEEIMNDTLNNILKELKVKNVINVHENNIAKGNINPIQRTTQLINIHLNSCFRENYYRSSPTNFKYHIPNGTIQNILSIKLSSIEIPNSWYLFSYKKNNNRFKIEITNCNKCSIHEIVIPDGNYDRDQLVFFLNDKYFINSANPLLKNIEFEIDKFTNKSYFKLTNNAPSDFEFNLHFVDDNIDNILETCGWILGFRLANYLKINDIVSSEGLFDGAGDKYIYLSINDYQQNYNENNIVCFDGTSTYDNIIAKIPMINGKFSFIINENNYNPLIKIRKYNGPVNLNKLEIKLFDKFNNIIDLNNMDWSFSLELEILYENII